MSEHTETPTEIALVAEFKKFNAIHPGANIPARRVLDVLRRLSFAWAEEGAEHLRDIEHCNQRVVNVLVPAKEMRDALGVSSSVSWDWEQPDSRLRKAYAGLAEAIAREEKEENQ